MSAYVSIRQHTSDAVSMRQHASAYFAVHTRLMQTRVQCSATFHDVYSFWSRSFEALTKKIDCLLHPQQRRGGIVLYHSCALLHYYCDLGQTCNGCLIAPLR